MVHSRDALDNTHDLLDATLLATLQDALDLAVCDPAQHTDALHTTANKLGELTHWSEDRLCSSASALLGWSIALIGMITGMLFAQVLPFQRRTEQGYKPLSSRDSPPLPPPLPEGEMTAVAASPPPPPTPSPPQPQATRR
jgi:hypothetical protein